MTNCLQKFDFKLLITILILSLVGCSAYYYKLKRLNKSFENYNFDEAQKILNSKKGINPNGKDKLLNYLNNGVISHMKGEYEQSNIYFEKAYKLMYNTQASTTKKVFAMLLNPAVEDYRGEDHEILFINYYKALNYLLLNNFEGACMECRRMDIALKRLRSKYGSKALLYKKDALLYTLMGIIYQAEESYDKAYNCYKMAIDIYRKEYKEQFSMKIPEQIKLDLLNAAYKTGLYSHLAAYEKIFGIKFNAEKYDKDCDIVILWHNGLGPIKDSLNISFVMNPAVGGLLYFKNEELGLNFAFPIPPATNKASIGDTKFFKISFPKYVERKPYFTKAIIEHNNNNYTMELVENINAISFKVLRQRMIWELGHTLLRLFLKKQGEHNLKKANVYAGFALGLINTIIENADTRNWQTMPHSVYYTRLKVNEGLQNINIKYYRGNRVLKIHKLNVNAKKFFTVFQILHTLEIKK